MTGAPPGPANPLLLDLGGRRFDLSRRALVMGILNRTTDSFYDGGAYFRLDDLVRRAEQLVADDADLLDIGARAAGVGTRTVSVAEEIDLVTSTIRGCATVFRFPCRSTPGGLRSPRQRSGRARCSATT